MAAKVKRPLAIALAALILLGLAGVWQGVPKPKPVTDSSEPKVHRKECDFLASEGINVRCYFVPVGEPGDNIQLSVAVLGNSQASDGGPPLVYLAGGPGQGNNTSPTMLSVWAQWYRRVGLLQDFILIDLRGLPLSQPNWDCEHYLEAAKQLWKLNLSFAEEAARSQPLLEECYRQLERLFRQHTPTVGIDQFSSVQNAADAAQVLDALGYPQWDFLGVSYGTRVALVAALTQPQVRRLILDSPYPLAYGQLSDTPILWSEAFKRFFDACDKGLWGCPEGVDSEALFWQVFERLNQQPLPAKVEDWSGGTRQTWLVNGERLAAVVYSAFYSSELYSMVYRSLAALDEGDAQPAQFLLEYFYNQAFDPEFNNLIFWATECNDNAAESEADYLAVVSGLHKWAPLFSADWDVDICHSSAFISAQKPSMSELDIPVLVAVGEWDPITPSRHGQTLMPWLSSGLYLPLTDRAHAEFYGDSCAVPLIKWFLSVPEQDLLAQWHEQRKVCH